MSSTNKLTLDATGFRDRMGHWTKTRYNTLRQVIRVEDPLGIVQEIDYCDCGSPSEIRQAAGLGAEQVTSTSYDGMGRPLITVLPTGSSITNGYDMAGRRVIIGDANGEMTQYFDSLNRLVEVWNAAGLLLSATVHDQEDRPVIRWDANGVGSTNTYDVLGRILSVTGQGWTQTYGYTAGIRAPTQMTNGVGDVTLHEYDPAGRRIREIQVGVYTNTFEYSPAGDLTRLVDGRGKQTLWTYDIYGRMVTKRHQGESTDDLVYSYNANGWLTNRLTRTGTGGSTAHYNTAYTYDATGNLTKVDYPAGTPDVEFIYDALHRPTTMVDGSGTTTWTYSLPGNGVFVTAENGPWSNDTVTVTNLHGLRSGMVIQQPTGSWTSACTPEGSRFKEEYVYDGRGRVRERRIWTHASGNWVASTTHRYLYDGMLIVQERTPSTPSVTYTRGLDLGGSLSGAGGIGGLLGRSTGYSSSTGQWSTHTSYHADGNGNIGAILDTSGNLQASYHYNPWGALLGISGSHGTANTMRHSSKPWFGWRNSNTAGLTYFGYRFYDPTTMRWLNRDPIGERGGLNLYAYVANNPVNRIDPYGLWQWGWPPWGKPKPKPPGQPPQKPKDKCTDCEKQDNAAKDLFKTAADTLAGEVGGKIGAMVRLILLAGDAKQGCGDMKGAADTCGDFASDPDQAGCLQCCHAIMNSFPNLGGFSYFQCHAICSKF